MKYYFDIEWVLCFEKNRIFKSFRERGWMDEGIKKMFSISFLKIIVEEGKGLYKYLV